MHTLHILLLLSLSLSTFLKTAHASVSRASFTTLNMDLKYFLRISIMVMATLCSLIEINQTYSILLRWMQVLMVEDEGDVVCLLPL